MKYYSDYSDLQEALAKVDKFGPISFTSVKGHLVLEDSQVEMYNKIQKLLNCDAMESAHGYLYNLDPEELTEAEASKVNNLWKLGCEKGYIEDIVEDAEADEEKDVDECDAVQAQASNLTPATVAQQQVAANAMQAMNTTQDAFTILYSAMRDGSVKTGEAYSNAINPRSAKSDVISQLEKAGYSNINILAIECGDPDCCGKDCTNTYVKQADMTPVATETPDEIPDYSADTSLPFESEEDKENVDEADKETDKKDADTEKADDKETDKEADDKKTDDKKTEKAEEPDEKLKDDADAEKKAADAEDDDKLDAAEKSALKDSYKKAFKAAMLKCKFEDRAFDDLTLEEKVQFFTVISDVWGSKADPSKFMEPKEVEQLEKITVKK